MTAGVSNRTLIIVLTLATALIHLGLGLTSGAPFNIIFPLNFLGYVALLAGLYFVPQVASMRGTIRWLFILYTAVTFLLYFVFNWPDVVSVPGLVTKAIELLLIVVLWRESEPA